MKKSIFFSAIVSLFFLMSSASQANFMKSEEFSNQKICTENKLNNDKAFPKI